MVSMISRESRKTVLIAPTLVLNMISGGYKIVTNAMDKCEHITDKDECDFAGTEFGVYLDWDWTGNEGSYCWYDNNTGGLKFNKKSKGTAPCDAKYSCVCRTSSWYLPSIDRH